MAGMEYAVVLVDDDGQVRAIVPDIPEIFAVGDDREDAIRAARACIELFLLDARERGATVPEPKAVEVVKVYAA
jgi:predicted RNase H-like HicB family nuclease